MLGSSKRCVARLELLASLSKCAKERTRKKKKKSNNNNNNKDNDDDDDAKRRTSVGPEKMTSLISYDSPMH